MRVRPSFSPRGEEILHILLFFRIPRLGDIGIRAFAPARRVNLEGEAGIEPSVGSKGDSYANALAETINAGVPRER